MLVHNKAINVLSPADYLIIEKELSYWRNT